MSTDREKLEALRISVGRIAQALGLSDTSISVVARGYEELAAQAKGNERGWNDLAAACVTEIQERDRRQVAACCEEDERPRTGPFGRRSF